MLVSGWIWTNESAPLWDLVANSASVSSSASVSLKTRTGWGRLVSPGLGLASPSVDLFLLTSTGFSHITDRKIKPSEVTTMTSTVDKLKLANIANIECFAFVRRCQL